MKKFTGKTIYLVIPFVLIFFALSAFAGEDGKAKDAYKKGQYEFAVKRLAQKLRDKDDHQDNIRLMEKCVKAAYTSGLREAEDFEMNGDLDGAVDKYTRLRDLSYEVSMLTVYKEVKINGDKRKQMHNFETIDVTNTLKELRRAALNDHYENGLFFEQQKDWRRAAVAYRHARAYQQNYKDVAVRYEACRKKGMIKIAVMPFDNLSGHYEFGAMGDYLSAQIVSSSIDANPEFIQFISREYLDQLLSEQGFQSSDVVDPQSAVKIGKMIGVHGFVFGKIYSIIPNTPPDLKANYNKQGTIKVYDEDKKKSIKVPTFCNYTVIERSRSVRVQASYQVILVETGEIVSSETLTQDQRDACSWIIVNRGNEELIPRNHRNKVTPGGQRQLSATEMLVSDAAMTMAKQLAEKLVARFES